MKRLPLIAGLLLTLAGPALAASVNFDFDGPGVSGSLVVRYGPATDARYADAYEVTRITGSFSSAAAGISNVRVRSLVAVNHATPEPLNLLAPNDFSRFAVASGLSPVSNGFLTYDNLFWPGGSPQTASDYLGQGGNLDIYGLMFRIGGGRVVDLWSNGDFGAGADYGVAVATVDRALDYVEGGVTATVAPVPVPGALWMLASGLVGLGFWSRRKAGA